MVSQDKKKRWKKKYNNSCLLCLKQPAQFVKPENFYECSAKKDSVVFWIVSFENVIFSKRLFE